MYFERCLRCPGWGGQGVSPTQDAVAAVGPHCREDAATAEPVGCRSEPVTLITKTGQKAGNRTGRDWSVKLSNSDKNNNRRGFPSRSMRGPHPEHFRCDSLICSFCSPGRRQVLSLQPAPGQMLGLRPRWRSVCLRVLRGGAGTVG